MRLRSRFPITPNNQNTIMERTNTTHTENTEAVDAGRVIHGSGIPHPYRKLEASDIQSLLRIDGVIEVNVTSMIKKKLPFPVIKVKMKIDKRLNTPDLMENVSFYLEECGRVMDWKFSIV
jgi:hypothetical protein